MTQSAVFDHHHGVAVIAKAVQYAGQPLNAV
jgi:hypothetical protein